jgi:hypothetical protein
LFVISFLFSNSSIIWSISTCASLARCALTFEFHSSLSPLNGPLGKLNKSNRFPLCSRFHNHLPNRYVKICEEADSDGI